MSDFTALRVIHAPNSYARAYNPGDPVLGSVVENWALVIGDDPAVADVQSSGDYVMPRPADDSNDRAAWESYVVSKGTSLDDARAASLDDLRGMYEPDPEPEPPAHDLPANVAPEGVDGAGVQNATPVGDNVPSPAPDPADGDASGGLERPNQSARKAEWVEYVIAAGGSAGWARDDDTTKDDLMAWEPGR